MTLNPSSVVMKCMAKYIAVPIPPRAKSRKAFLGKEILRPKFVDVQLHIIALTRPPVKTMGLKPTGSMAVTSVLSSSIPSESSGTSFTNGS